MTTGQLIQTARKRANLSQRELGAELGVSGSMIGQYENDLRHPKYETLKKIAKVLKVKVTDLAPPLNYWEDENGVEHTEEMIPEWAKEPSEADLRNSLNAAFSKLNPSGQQKAVERVEELTEIPKYQCQETPSENDTTPPADAPKAPSEGK